MANPLSYIFFFLTSLILLSSSSIAAQTEDNISVGSSLTATTNSSSAWHSPSGDFALGFHQYPNQTNQFLLAIWYAKIPDTIVWYANAGNPVPRGSTVKLTPKEGLILTDPQGSPLWNTSAHLTEDVIVGYGYMNDTGNFILKSSSNAQLWQSFDSPTDTLLPTQLMKKNGVLNSRLSEDNLTQGRFQMHLQNDGNLVMNVIDLNTYLAASQPYYASMTYTYSPPDHPDQGARVIYDENGQMYLEAENGTTLTNFIPEDNIFSISDYYHRATLNFYGVLTWYYHPRKFANQVGWSKMYSLKGNICSVGCGYNSLCTYDSQAQDVTCNCPSNYSPIDPNDKYGSCKPDFELWQEDGVNVKYGIVPLLNTKFGDKCGGDEFRGINEEQCKSSCLNDRFCAVTTWDNDIDNGGTCCKIKPLFIGETNGNSVATAAWLKVGNATQSPIPLIPCTPLPEIKSSSRQLNTVVSVLLGGSVIFNITLLSLVIFFIYHKKQLGRQVEPRKDYGNVHCFSYKVVTEATDGYKEELGRGAFGTVYKGKLKAGGSPTYVAVKKLDRISNHADQEFETEVNVIGMTHHKNLVRLVGFCKEKDQRLLVYEFMSNGSLADHLFGDLRPSWYARTQIAQGIARGLLYLHEECITQIIHCDIKPQNILIDEHQQARICDFGMAKLLALDQSYTNTAIRGTKGYVAPEWFRNRPVTTKVDVYSFGVLLLEILFCRRNVSLEIIEQDEAILTDWVFDCYRFNTLDNLVNNHMEALQHKLQFYRFVLVALWCIQVDPSLRPSMKMVTLMLEGFAQVPPPPCQTSFISATQE